MKAHTSAEVNKAQDGFKKYCEKRKYFTIRTRLNYWFR